MMFKREFTRIDNRNFLDEKRKLSETKDKHLWSKSKRKKADVKEVKFAVSKQKIDRRARANPLNKWIKTRVFRVLDALICLIDSFEIW